MGVFKSSLSIILVVKVDPITLPEELKHRIERFPDVDWQEVERKAIELKLFELELERSEKMRRIVVESISSESGLSEEEADKFAVELGRKIKKGRFEQLKRMGLV